MKGRRTIRAWAVIFWLFLWQSGAMVINQRIILVSPLRVLARLAELAPTPEFWGAIGYSLVRITAGFLLGVAAGREPVSSLPEFSWEPSLPDSAPSSILPPADCAPFW